MSSFDFTSHFTASSANNATTIDNSSNSSLAQIQWIPGCDVFQEKHVLAIANIFCQSYEINHKLLLMLNLTFDFLYLFL